jgi:glyceraldehyde-3-phosphate dehydrogenase/erythrose-4-phosphate dehydrogenase
MPGVAPHSSACKRQKMLEPDQLQFRTDSKIIRACSCNTYELSPVFHIVHSEIASETNKYSEHAEELGIFGCKY